jgi:glycosyltransferase involved in cell wall biosynthesis
MGRWHPRLRRTEPPTTASRGKRASCVPGAQSLVPSICVLDDGPVTHDGRVQRTVRTLSEVGRVLLLTCGGSERDQELFGENVQVRPTTRPDLAGLPKYLLLHRQCDHLADAALAQGRGFDIVWANDYSTLAPAGRIARESGAKLVYDSHDLWLATVNQFFPINDPFPRGPAFRAIVGLCRAFGYWNEPRMARDADLVVTANESFAEVLHKRLGRDDVIVMLNCPELAGLDVSDRIRTELGFAETDAVVLYQGMMNPGRGLPELVKSARDLPDGVRIVMLGHGPIEGDLRRTVESEGLQSRVFMPGTVPQGELHSWTASADLGVLILDPINLSKRLALANKIFEYMAAGIPILTTDLPENRRILDQCDCGWLVTDWAPSALARHIATILEDPDEMRRRGANGRSWFEERFNWEHESRRLLEAVEVLLPGEISTRAIP